MPVSMTKRRIPVLFLCLILTLSGCGKGTAAENNFDAFTDSLFRDTVVSDTIALHFHVSDPENYQLTEPDPCWPDESYQTLQESSAEIKTTLETCRSYEDAGLTDSQQLTLDVLEDYLTRQNALSPYLLYRNPFDSNFTAGSLERTLCLYAFSREKDVKDYLSLLSQIPSVFETALEFEKSRRDAGIYLSEIQKEKILDQISATLEASDQENLLITSFDEKIEKMEDLSEDQKNTYKNNNLHLVHDTVLPAYESLQKSLQQLPEDPEKRERLCQYEDGAAYYTALLQANVGTDLTPEECITAMKEQAESSLETMKTLLNSDPDLSLEYQSALPALDDEEDILSELSADTRIHFPWPEGMDEVSYEIQEMPAALSSSSSQAFYLLPAIDGKQTNLIYINSAQTGSDGLFSTLAHEAYPGHLYQKNYMLLSDLPDIRHLTSCTGYDEGWGTYAQIYAYRYYELKDVSRDTQQSLQTLYQSQDILNISLLSLSDLYVNYKDYDAGKLADFLTDYGVEESRAETVYQYVINYPCTYLSYGVGYYELMDLLAEQRQQEGDDFDLDRFHKAVLDAGSCSFPVLKKYLE